MLKPYLPTIDRTPYLYRWAVETDWLVHYESAGMNVQGGCQAEEHLYLTRPEAMMGARAMAALAGIARRWISTMVVITFRSLPMASALIFETNATMLAHPEDPGREIAHKNPTVDRIIEAFRRRLGEAAAS